MQGPQLKRDSQEEKTKKQYPFNKQATNSIVSVPLQHFPQVKDWFTSFTYLGGHYIIDKYHTFHITGLFWAHKNWKIMHVLWITHYTHIIKYAISLGPKLTRPQIAMCAGWKTPVCSQSLEMHSIQNQSYGGIHSVLHGCKVSEKVC